MRLRNPFSLPVSLCIVAILSGCSEHGAYNPVPAIVGVTGQVHGGQQPVSGAAIQLYAVGTTGDASAAQPLLTQAVLTDANGGFNITGLYSCTNATQVYITATGGNPGIGANNSNLALMTALGPCSGLTPTTFISINEVTTVAAVAALAPYTSSYSFIGSGTSDAAALAQAFVLASQLADPSAGSSPGQNLPPQFVVPTDLINSLADSIASCINTAGGSSGSSTPCGMLFSLTTAGSSVPADTIGALLNIQNNPTQNITPLLDLSTPASPFQPQLTTTPVTLAVALLPSPLYFGTTSISYPTTPLGATDASQNIVVTNITNNPITIRSIYIAGAAPTDFAESNNCPGSLVKAASCTISVSFAPTAIGTRTASVVVNTINAVGSVPLSGPAVAASAGPATLSATALTLYELGAPQAVTLTNAGTNPLAIQSISINSTNFSQTNNCGAFLSGQSYCTINILTSVAGQFTGTLTVLDSDTTDIQTVQLSSSTVYSQLVDFGTAAVGLGTNSGDRSFTGGVVTNSGNNYFVTYSATFGGPAAGDWIGDPASCTGFASGYPFVTCPISFYFNPTAPGTRYSTVITNSGQQWLFKGTATVPVIPGPFPTITPIPQLGQPNGGEHDHWNNHNFKSPVHDHLLRQRLLERCRVQCQRVFFGRATIYMRPVRPLYPEHNWTSLSYSEPNLSTHRRKHATVLPLTSQITGNGGAGLPAAVQFGDVPVGTTSPVQTVTVTMPNKDSATAQIAGASSPFAIPGSFFCATGAATCQFGLTFSPTALGQATDTLIITDTVTGLQSTSNLFGTGGTPAVGLSTTSLNFGTRTQGTTSLPQTITVNNTGNAPLAISSISFAGANPADYAQTNTCSAAVSPGSSCTISITNTPTGTSASSATLVIASNAAGPSSTVSLTALGD